MTIDGIQEEEWWYKVTRIPVIGLLYNCIRKIRVGLMVSTLLKTVNLMINFLQRPKNLIKWILYIFLLFKEKWKSNSDRMHRWFVSWIQEDNSTEKCLYIKPPMCLLWSKTWYWSELLFQGPGKTCGSTLDPVDDFK